MRAFFLVACLLCACAADRGTIGAVLGRSPDGEVTIREVPPDLAAAKADLTAGDEILLIDGRDVRQMSEKALRRALEGPVGAPVRLTVLRGEEVIRVTVRRSRARRRRRPADGGGSVR